MVRVRGIFQSYDAFHKRDNKKARSLDKVPKLRAFPARSYLSDNCSWLREPDLNGRPSGYEPDELPSCSIPRFFFRLTFDVVPCPYDFYIIAYPTTKVNYIF